MFDFPDAFGPTSTVSGDRLRKILGYSHLKGARFKVRSKKGRFTFEGAGVGHGVGMCQWGAKGMGDTGDYTYRQILGFYYPGLHIGRISTKAQLQSPSLKKLGARAPN